MRRLVHEVDGLEGAKEVGTSTRSQLYLMLSDSFATAIHTRRFSFLVNSFHPG